MGLAAGCRLGPYEITAAIGAGGMGEVYKARDTRLGRTVALKVLSAAAAADPDCRARFEREARAISSIAHPNVCALYDVGRLRAEGASASQAEIDFLVMEHLDGETLAQRLQRGPIALGQALEYAAQIAAGLHEAHHRGIVHRDLKPGNVMITRSGARLLDFGVAALRGRATQTAGGAETTLVLTAEHAIVGTIAYMSPEQVRGEEVDARSDIFSFGVLLFELVTGRLPFEGTNPASTMAAILEKEPPALGAVLPGAPRPLERLIQYCLIKDPGARWQSARDLELELQAIRSHAGEPPRDAAVAARRPRRLARIAIAGLLLAAAGIAGYAAAMGLRRGGDPARRVVRFSIPLAAAESIHEHSSSSIALAPDGARIAYAVNRPDARGLYVRSFDAPAAAWIAGGERAASPFFSPDGRWIAFESGGSLKKVDADGGTPVTLCDTPYFAGGSWGPDGIVFVPSFTGGLFRIAADGGRPSRLTTVDGAKGEGAHLWPQALPDGRVLFTIWMGGGFDEATLALFSPQTGKYAVVHHGGFYGRYTSGRLIFARGGRLFHMPFDLDRGGSGNAEQIVDGVAGDSAAGIAMFSVDDRGTLAYVPGSQRPLQRSLVAIDAKGVRRTISAAPRAFVSVRLSPDGQRLAAWIEEASTGIWLKEMSRDPLTRLTFSGDDHGPVWSPDGRSIAFESGRASTHHIFVGASDGSAGDRQVTFGEHHHYLSDWSPRGDALIYTEFHPETGADLWLVNPEGTPRPRAFRATRFAEKQAAFSPNGEWIAYVANDSDRLEVYVQAASGPPQRTRISSDGGEEPAWSRSGDRLFYRSGGRMMAVPVTAGDTFVAGRPVVQFAGLYHYNISPNRTYDVTKDGGFIMITLPDPASSPRQIDVILDRLRERS